MALTEREKQLIEKVILKRHPSVKQFISDLVRVVGRSAIKGTKNERQIKNENSKTR